MSKAGDEAASPGAHLYSSRRPWRILVCSVVWPLLASCVSLTVDPRALVYETTGITVQSLDCVAATRKATAYRPPADVTEEIALDPDDIRIVSWNIHKQSDEGWSEELKRMAHANDVLLLQEVSLSDEVQSILEAAGLRWILASSFIQDDTDIGVLTATRAAPFARCTQRTDEPLARIPKSAVVTWVRFAGTPQTLAIANIHAINFTLMLDAYRAQLDALATVLAAHPGPVVLAGDLNTWSAARTAVVREVAARLNLVEVGYADDRRSKFLGHAVDHVFVRGLDIVSASANVVRSSDHNPLEVVLRLPPTARGRPGMIPPTLSEREPVRSAGRPGGTWPTRSSTIPTPTTVPPRY